LIFAILTEVSRGFLQSLHTCTRKRTDTLEATMTTSFHDIFKKVSGHDFSVAFHLTLLNTAADKAL
jgi:hypothetical protein